MGSAGVTATILMVGHCTSGSAIYTVNRQDGWGSRGTAHCLSGGTLVAGASQLEESRRAGQAGGAEDFRIILRRSV